MPSSGKKISDDRYWLAPAPFNLTVETGAILVTALLIALFSLVLFDGPIGPVACLLGWAMLAITVCDARDFIVPDVLSLPAIPLGIIVSALLAGEAGRDHEILVHVVATVVSGGAFYAIRVGFQHYRGHEGLGLGDVKLAAVAGAWTELQGASLIVLGASLAAMLFVVAQHAASRAPISGTTRIAFGAFLAPAIWLVWALIQLGLVAG